MTTELTVQKCDSKQGCSTFSKRPHAKTCTHYRGMLTSHELRLADIVLTGGTDGYSCATVSQVKDGMVTLFRPYTQTADFSYTGGVICYIGIEQFSVYQDSNNTWQVVGRKELK